MTGPILPVRVLLQLLSGSIVPALDANTCDDLYEAVYDHLRVGQLP